MNSAAQTAAVEQPEEVVDFNTFYKENGFTGTQIDPNNMLSKIANWFIGDVDSAKKMYESYLNNVNIRNEARATQSARAWEEYMDSTKYQRAFQDLEKAGLNPYLLVNGGQSLAAGSSSSPKASYSKPSIKDEQKSTGVRDFALILLGIARLLAVA